MLATKVYIAGPYTKGDVAINVRNAIEAADVLLENGFVPFIPHFTHFWHMIFPKPYERWLQYDNQWIGSCDCVLRLPGESNGADLEVEFARMRGIPVYFSIDDLISVYSNVDYKHSFLEIPA